MAVRYGAVGFQLPADRHRCALGLEQLKKLEPNLSRRRKIAARYTAAFREVRGVNPPSVRTDVNPAWHLYPIRLDFNVLSAGRGEAFSALRAENIGVNVHYIPVYHHSYFRDRFGYKGGEYPVAEALRTPYQPSHVSWRE